jgi:hypothetical protein
MLVEAYCPSTKRWAGIWGEGKSVHRVGNGFRFVIPDTMMSSDELAYKEKKGYPKEIIEEKKKYPRMFSGRWMKIVIEDVAYFAGDEPTKGKNTIKTDDSSKTEKSEPSNADHIEKKRGCPPGGWPKKADVPVKPSVPIDAKEEKPKE